MSPGGMCPGDHIQERKGRRWSSWAHEVGTIDQTWRGGRSYLDHDDSTAAGGIFGSRSNHGGEDGRGETWKWLELAECVDAPSAALALRSRPNLAPLLQFSWTPPARRHLPFCKATGAGSGPPDRANRSAGLRGTVMAARWTNQG